MAEEDGVETQADFASKAKESGLMDWLLDSAPGEDASGPAPDQPVDTGSAVERPRDEKGRFAPRAEEPEVPEGSPFDENPADPASEEAPEEPAEDEDIVIELDDDLQSVLERYDGDVAKALLALKEKDSMVGRQANEVGELRSQLQEMRQLMEQGFAQQPVNYGPYVNDLDENPKGLVAEALERGDQQTLAIAVRAWGEEEPFEAAAFLFSLQNQPQPEPAPAPPAQRESAVGLEGAMASVVARHPDVEQYLPHLEGVAAEFPTLRNFMQQGTPAQKAQAFEELLVITKTRASQPATSAAMKRVVLRTQEEARKERADAALVSASRQTAATATQGLDAFRERFAEVTGQLAKDDWITRSNE